MLGQPTRPKSAQQREQQQAKRELRPFLNSVLSADDDKWLPMMQHARTVSNPVVTRLTVDLLIEKLTGKHETNRDRATTWLVLIGLPAEAALLGKLQRSRSTAVMVALVKALGQLGSALSAWDRTLLWFRLEHESQQTQHSEVRDACAKTMVRLRKLGTLHKAGGKTLEDLYIISQL